MTIALFLLSMFVLCALIGSKVFELKVRRIHPLADAFIKGDKKIHQLIETALSKYNLYRKIANIFVFEFLPSYLYEVLHKMKDYVSKRYYDAEDRLRGRRILRTNGSVSSFLERLGEEKSHVRSRKA